MIEFRNKYEEDERLFSTGNEDLDILLEEVYYSGIEDGYDYFQKEFTNPKLKKKVMDTVYGPDPIGLRMAKRIRSGELGRKYGAQEAKNYGGYGKWHRELVAEHEAAQAAKRTHPERMREIRRRNMMADINGGEGHTIQDRLKTYKYYKSQGLSLHYKRP